MKLKWTAWLMIIHWQKFHKNKTIEIKKCLKKIIDNEFCNYVIFNKKTDIYNKIKIFFIKHFGLDFYLNKFYNFTIKCITSVVIQFIELKNFLFGCESGNKL